MWYCFASSAVIPTYNQHVANMKLNAVYLLYNTTGAHLYGGRLIKHSLGFVEDFVTRTHVDILCNFVQECIEHTPSFRNNEYEIRKIKKQVDEHFSFQQLNNYFMKRQSIVDIKHTRVDLCLEIRSW